MIVALGMDTLVRLLQPSNALPPIFVTSGKDASVRPLEENAANPIIVANGKDTLVSLLQPLNALRPMLVATGKDTLVRLEQFWNAY